MKPPIIVRVPLEPDELSAVRKIANASGHTVESVIIAAVRDMLDTINKAGLMPTRPLERGRKVKT